MSYTNGLDKPTDYFDTSTWTATTSAISNLDFSPDWVWIKSTDSANGHILFDTIRGANERLSSSSDGAESTRTDELMSFDSNGYTLGSSGNTNDTSPFNASYVGWSWRGSDSSAVSNTDGSITSTVSANTTAGFSIVSFTGTGANATVGHGLGSAVNMIIVKNRDRSSPWWVTNTSLGFDKQVRLNETNASQTEISIFNDTAPTSSVFTVGTNSGSNQSGENHIAYCFAEKKGFSKFGSYVGNGNADGTFIYTGFKPAWLLAKKSSGTGDWFLIDNKRSTINPTNHQLEANSNAVEDASGRFDFLSNGFKCVSTSTGSNGSGTTYIYMAFSENPFVTSTGIPTTAR